MGRAGGLRLCTGKQIQYWINGETLFAHNVKVDPKNFIAQNSYAAYFLANHELSALASECRRPSALIQIDRDGSRGFGPDLFAPRKI